MGLENGRRTYERLVAFIGDNVEYYSEWLSNDVDSVIQSAAYTMGNIAMYDDAPDEYKLTGGAFDLLDALYYVLSEYIVDDIGYHVIDNNESVMHILGLAVLEEL